MSIFFSVIIPTYNRSLFLKRALNSVYDQSFKNFECIVIDDGSTDETEEICGQFTVKYIYTRNSGVSSARNLGARKAQGNWLAFLDSDDEWLPEKLQKQHAFIQRNPQYKIVHGNEVWFKNGQLKNQKKKHRRSGGDIFIPSLKLCLISPSTVVIRKDLFAEYGGFREDFPVCEDYDLWLRITANENIGFVEDNLINKFGGHQDQLSQRYKAMDYWRVKAIDYLLSKTRLRLEYREAAISELKIKCQILLQGYQKHNRKIEYNEILRIAQKYTDHELQ